MLVSVDEADAVLMDRWTILLDGHEASGVENGLADMEPPKVPGAWVKVWQRWASSRWPYHVSRDFPSSHPPLAQVTVPSPLWTGRLRHRAVTARWHVSRPAGQSLAYAMCHAAFSWMQVALSRAVTGQQL